MPSDVKWIRIDTDMFSNPKIKRLRRLPEGNNILLIWVMLLTMAGICNADGMIFITRNVLYTEEDLADELGFSVDTVKLAIRSFEEMGMVTTENSILEIVGWKDHQNVDGLDKIREQTRKRVAKHRKKEIEECNVTVTLPVTHSSYSYSKSKSNILNLNSLLEDSNYINNSNYKEYILSISNNKELLETFRRWLSYKDEKKDKYAESSMLSLIKKFVTERDVMDEVFVEDVVEYSILNNYKGLFWDEMKKKSSKHKKQETNVFDEWRNA